MPRQKARTQPSLKARPGRKTLSSSVGLGHEQTSLDKWLDLGNATQSLASLVKAQEIIQEAQEKGGREQNAAIIVAIENLYTFPPWDGQREALHHFVFLRKDMILIAKTSFRKSMLLQAVSLLLKNAISLTVLPLNQIVVEQTEYIQLINRLFCTKLTEPDRGIAKLRKFGPNVGDQLRCSHGLSGVSIFRDFVQLSDHFFLLIYCLG